MIDISIDGIPIIAALQVTSPSWEEKLEASEAFSKISKALSHMPLPAAPHLAKERISSIETIMPFIRSGFHVQSKELADLQARVERRGLHTVLHIARLAGAVAAVAGVALGATLLSGKVAAIVIATSALAHLAMGIINLNYTFEDYSGSRNDKKALLKTFGATIGLGVLTPLYDLFHDCFFLSKNKEKLEGRIRTGLQNAHCFYEENAEIIRKGITTARDRFHDANNRAPYDKALEFFNKKIPQMWAEAVPQISEEELRFRLLKA